MKYNINLVQKKGLTLFEKVIYFFSNYLRYILVITQLVVICVLFYRFRVDQNIIDLKESIDQKKEIVEVTSPLINEAKKIQLKSNELKKIIGMQNSLSSMTDYVLTLFPQEIFLQKMEIEPTSIKMSGTAFDPKQLQLYYGLLRRDKRFLSVQLNDLKKDGGAYSFTLQLNGYVVQN